MMTRGKPAAALSKLPDTTGSPPRLTHNFVTILDIYRESTFCRIR